MQKVLNARGQLLVLHVNCSVFYPEINMQKVLNARGQMLVLHVNCSVFYPEINMQKVLNARGQLLVLHVNCSVFYPELKHAKSFKCSRPNVGFSCQLFSVLCKLLEQINLRKPFKSRSDCSSRSQHEILV